jgi:hypothetical protein
LPRKPKAEDAPEQQETPAAPAMSLSATIKQSPRQSPRTAPGKPGGEVQETPETNPARWMHERLVNQIVEFEKGLDADHEVGGRFVQGPNNEPLHIENVASWGPDMIVFVGKYADGRKFELIQHYSQVNLFLVAMHTETEEPRRIGFDLIKAINDAPRPWGDPVA